MANTIPENEPVLDQQKILELCQEYAKLKLRVEALEILLKIKEDK